MTMEVLMAVMGATLKRIKRFRLMILLRKMLWKGMKMLVILKRFNYTDHTKQRWCWCNCCFRDRTRFAKRLRRHLVQTRQGRAHRRKAWAIACQSLTDTTTHTHAAERASQATP